MHPDALVLHQALPGRADRVQAHDEGSSWRVIVRLIDGRVTLDLGWPPFAAVHQIKIGYMVTFKLLTPDTLKVIVFNDDGIEVVTKCGRHDDVFAVNI